MNKRAKRDDAKRRARKIFSCSMISTQCNDFMCVNKYKKVMDEEKQIQSETKENRNM